MAIPSEASNIGKIPGAYQEPPASKPASGVSSEKVSGNMAQSTPARYQEPPDAKIAGHDVPPLEGIQSPSGSMASWRDNAKGV